jgi:hypothetical protein
MPCCLVHLLGQSLLVLIDRGESGDIGLKRDCQVRLVDADVDVLGKTLDQAISLTEAGTALKIEAD